MTKIATMGTSSCATIALQGFKNSEEYGCSQHKLNEDYLKDPESFKLNKGMSVKDFYNDILYPVRQDLGRTQDYPFELLMKELEASSMSKKFVIVTLNAFQQNMEEGYWPQQLKKWGFECVEQTDNSIGSRNFIYTRCPLRPETMTEV